MILYWNLGYASASFWASDVYSDSISDFVVFLLSVIFVLIISAVIRLSVLASSIDIFASLKPTEFLRSSIYMSSDNN